MLSHLYYDRGVSLVNDDEYDRLSNDVADIWGELPPQLRWQLGPPRDLRATGMGVRLTRASVGGAEALAADKGITLPPYAFTPYGVSRRFGVEFTRVRG